MSISRFLVRKRVGDSLVCDSLVKYVSQLPNCCCLLDGDMNAVQPRDVSSNLVAPKEFSTLNYTQYRSWQCLGSLETLPVV